MEILKEKFQNFLDAYSALGSSIEVQKELQSITIKNSNAAQNLWTAGIIKHFELTYETAWKFLKQYLNRVYEIDVASPKAVFRACRERGILSDVMVDELLELAEVRNLTTHVYNRILAQEVGMSIEDHYKIFEALTKLMDGI